MDFVKNLRKDQIKKDRQTWKYEDSDLDNKIIDRNTQKVFELVNISNMSAESKDYSDDIIQKGSELFLYLNPLLKGSTLNYWSEFYSDLFTASTSVQQKVLSLVKILNNPKSKDSQEIASEILVQLSRELRLKYYKPEISREGIKNQITWKNDLVNIEGTILKIEEQ